MSFRKSTQDDHTHPTNLIVSSSSQSGTSSFNVQRPIDVVQPQPPISSAIAKGAERFLALFEDEKQHIEAQQRKQIDDIQARFDEFRKNAAQEQQRLADRIYLLEAELAARGGDAMGGDSMHDEIDGQNDTTLDMKTIHLVRDLARLVKDAEFRTNLRGRGTFDLLHLPKSFLPVLARYLASNKQAMRDLQKKHRAGVSQSAQFNNLHGAVQVDPFFLQPTKHINPGFVAPGSGPGLVSYLHHR